MKTNFQAKILFLGTLSLALFGCGDREADEAKVLGFSNIEEMREAHSKGWHKKSRMDADIEIQKSEEAAIAAGYKSAREMKAALEKEKREREQQIAREAARKEKEEQERIAEEQQRASDPFPYIAIFSCGMMKENINILACFSDSVKTELEMNNGGKYGLYNAWEINSLGQQDRTGLRINLSRHFSIKAQNASKFLKLGLVIQDKYTGEAIFEKQVATYGVIAVKN